MTKHPYISCRELIDFIADYLDGTLPEANRREFDRHLTVCPSCIVYVDGYRKTIAMSKTTMKPSDSPAFGVAPEWLVNAVLTARAGER